MNDVPKSWRSLLDDLKRETDPSRRSVVCEKARRAMQERLIELSTRDESPTNFAEQREIEEALRKVWTIERTLRKPST